MIEETSWLLIIFGKSLHILKRALHILRKEVYVFCGKCPAYFAERVDDVRKEWYRGDLTVATAIFPIEHGP